MNAAATAATPAPETVEHDTTHPCVLIVDDDALTREVCSINLQLEGLRVLEAEDGTFVHFVTLPTDPENNPMRSIAAFRAFTANGRERQVDEPVVKSARIVGNYRMLAEHIR